MKKIAFNTKKIFVRAFIALGALLGISSCSNSCSSFRPESVYGPPPDMDSDSIYTGKNKEIEVVEDVYGPPVVEPDTITEEIEITER